MSWDGWNLSSKQFQSKSICFSPLLSRVNKQDYFCLSLQIENNNCQRFVNRIMNWKYALHLDVLVANNIKCIMIGCATSLKSTLKACSLIPPKGDNVCDE